MIALAIQEKTIDLTRAQEQAKQATTANQRISCLLNVSVLTSQLNYLLTIQKASNNK